MAKLGFTRFEDVGDAFDPQRHEAVTTIASDAPPGTVIDAVRPGYDGDPVLRPASVVVARSLGDG